MRLKATRVSDAEAERLHDLRLPRLSLRQREAALGLLFVAPQLIGWAIFVGGPLLAILYFSFFRWNIIQGTLTFIGTANFERMLTSQRRGGDRPHDAAIRPGLRPLDGDNRPGVGSRSQQSHARVHRLAGGVLPAGGGEPGGVDASSGG